MISDMISFSHACRLCLKNEPSNVEIFSMEGQRRSLAQKLWKYFSIWTGVQEPLPKTVCQLCIGEIERFSAFCRNVEEVQKSIWERISHTPKSVHRDADISSDNYIKVDHVPYIVGGSAEKENETSEHAENTGQTQVLATAADDTHNVNNSVVDLASDDSHHSADAVVEHATSHVDNIIEIVKNDDCLYNGDSNLTDDEIACMNLPATDNSQSHESAKDRRNAEMASFYNFCCQMCRPEETFDKYEFLDQHCQTHHGKRGAVVCCGKELIGRVVLRRHMMSHFQQFKCPQCGKQLANRSTLRCHILAIHVPNDRRPYKCSQCPKRFIIKDHLQRHEETHKEEAANLSFTCDICGKICTNSYRLYTHKRYSHKRSNSAMCHICAKTFPTISALQQHLKRHDTEREYLKCSECGKMLKNRDTLRSHMRLHKGEEFRCTECSRVCNSASGLRTHLLCHSNNWPHQCHLCKKLFKRKAGLRAHLVIHTGEQPFKCPLCPRTFASKSNYYTHKLRMHMKRKEDDNETAVVQVNDMGEKRYQCPQCTRIFANKSNYYTHKLRKHTKKIADGDENTHDMEEDNESNMEDENTNDMENENITGMGDENINGMEDEKMHVTLDENTIDMKDEKTNVRLD